MLYHEKCCLCFFMSLITKRARELGSSIATLVSFCGTSISESNSLAQSIEKSFILSVGQKKTRWEVTKQATWELLLNKGSKRCYQTEVVTGSRNPTVSETSAACSCMLFYFAMLVRQNELLNESTLVEEAQSVGLAFFYGTDAIFAGRRSVKHITYAALVFSMLLTVHS